MNPLREGGRGGRSLTEGKEKGNQRQKKRGGRRKLSRYQNSGQEGSRVDTQSTGILQESWGDDMVEQQNWPENMERMRILSCNLGGISRYNNLIEWDVILGYIFSLQVDIFCFSELSLNLKNTNIIQKLYEYSHARDRHISLDLQCSSPKKRSDEYQRGGLI